MSQETEKSIKCLNDWADLESPGYRLISGKLPVNPEKRAEIYHVLGIRGDEKLLDCGCGPGDFCEIIKNGIGNNGEYVGLDGSLDYCLSARDFLTDRPANATFVNADAIHIPFSDNSFDHVTSHLFFYQVFEKKTVLNEMIRVVKPGGTVSALDPLFLTKEWDYPDKSPKLIDLETKLMEARNRVFIDFRPKKEENVKVTEMTQKLPRLFGSAGLTGISYGAIALTRRPLDLGTEGAIEYFAGLAEIQCTQWANLTDYLSPYGVSEEDINRYRTLLTNYYRDLSKKTRNRAIDPTRVIVEMAVRGKKPTVSVGAV